MSRHFMKLRAAPFEAMLRGRKTAELRLNDDKRRKIRPGDEIEFDEVGGDRRTLLAKVLWIKVFPSFRELYEELSPEEMGYPPEEIKNAKYTDMEEYYSKEEQEEYGAVAIGITVIG